MPAPHYSTTGGTFSYSMYSGTAGGHVCVTSGTGRLNGVLTHNASLSGQAVTFYDSAVAVSGGPLATSGHKILFVIPAAPPLGVSGTFNTPATLYDVRVPFNSGLCITSASGQPGVSVFYTYESGRFLA